MLETCLSFNIVFIDLRTSLEFPLRFKMIVDVRVRGHVLTALLACTRNGFGDEIHMVITHERLLCVYVLYLLY